MLLFRIVSDSTDDDLMSYNMGVDLVDAPRQLHREQIAPNGTASGPLSQGVKRDPQVLRLARSAPKETNEPTLRNRLMTLETYATRFLIVLTGAASVWLFFYQPEPSATSFTHSGTQPFVRVVR